MIVGALQLPLIKILKISLDGVLRHVASFRGMADDIDLDFVTLKEATAICRFKTTRPIQNAIKNREITPYRVNPHHILIAKTELVRWLVQHRGRPVKSRKNGDKK